nr:choice-of-anchor C family protein [uncultured Rhodoferax sp.]
MQKIHALTLAVALLAGATQANATNLVANGGFESETVQNTGAGFDTFNSISQGLTGWTVNLRTVDLVSNAYWTAASGNNSLDLNGLGKGVISQVLSTVVGQIYTLSFELAGNPVAGPAIKGLSVNLGPIGLYSFDTTGHSTTNMGWTRYTTQFAAVSTSTTLSFASQVSGPAGPALDNISVSAVPEPETYALLLAGLGLMGTVARRRQLRKAA